MLLATLLALQTAAAQDPFPAPELRDANGPVPPAVTAALAARAPSLDGRLDDAELRALGGDDQTNTLLVKFNYWIRL